MEDFQRPLRLVISCCNDEHNISGFEKYVEHSDRFFDDDASNQFMRLSDLPNGLTLRIGRNAERNFTVIIEVFREE